MSEPEQPKPLAYPHSPGVPADVDERMARHGESLDERMDRHAVEEAAEAAAKELTALVRGEIDDEGQGMGHDFYEEADRQALAERLTKALLANRVLVARVLLEASGG